jgi:twitching motility protein PilT
MVTGADDRMAPEPRIGEAADQMLLSSLLTAIARVDGDALVMHVGECPYVVALSGVIELSGTPVTLATMTRMLDRLLPAEERTALELAGAVQHELSWAEAGGERFRLVAAWGGDDIWTEIRRYRKEMADDLGIAFGASCPADPTETLAGSPPAREPVLTEQDARLDAAGDPFAVVVPLQRVDPRSERPSPDRAGLGLDDFIRLAATRHASALYMVTQSRPMIRVDGELTPLDAARPLEAFEVEALFQELASEAVPATGARPSSGREWSRDVADVGRVRCLAFRDNRGRGLQCRLIPVRPASADELGLSREIRNLVTWPDGLIVVTGQRMSGKSTLLSALVDLINSTRSVHLIVLERQLRVLHENQRSFVSQREIRGDATDMASAVRLALREDPDVLVIGDMRSGETIALALEAAESGRLVLGTFPAAGAVVAIERMLGHVPMYRRLEYRRMLAGTLRGAVAQVLLPKIGGGRLAARELLLNTPRVAELIAEGKMFELPGALESGRPVGMVPMNDALAAFVQRGVAEAPEAYRAAIDREGLVQALRRLGVDTSFVERRA